MKQIWSRPRLEVVILHSHRTAKDNSKLMEAQNDPMIQALGYKGVALPCAQQVEPPSPSIVTIMLSLLDLGARSRYRSRLSVYYVRL